MRLVKTQKVLELLSIPEIQGERQGGAVARVWGGSALLAVPALPASGPDTSASSTSAGIELPSIPDIRGERQQVTSPSSEGEVAILPVNSQS